MSINYKFHYGANMRWIIKNLKFLFCIVCGMVIPFNAYSAEPVQLNVTWNYTDSNTGVAGFRLYSTNNLICETSDPAARNMTCTVVAQGQSMPFAMTAYDATGKESAASDLFWVDFRQTPTPVDLPPVAYITANPVYGLAPLQVHFDGSQSLDPDGTIVAYFWDFSDGDQAGVASPAHTFSVPGVYAVSLVVTDDKGNTAKADSMVTIVGNAPGQTSPGKLPPTAVIAVQMPAVGSSSLLVSFDGGKSADDDGTVAVYRWDFGDGDSGAGDSVGHTYEAPGEYTVTLVVADNDGLTGLARKEIILSALPVVQPADVPPDNVVPDGGAAATSGGAGGGGCSVLQYVGDGPVGVDWLLSLIFITVLPLVTRLRRASGTIS